MKWKQELNEKRSNWKDIPELKTSRISNFNAWQVEIKLIMEMNFIYSILLLSSNWMCIGFIWENRSQFSIHEWEFNQIWLYDWNISSKGKRKSMPIFLHVFLDALSV